MTADPPGSCPVMQPIIQGGRVTGYRRETPEERAAATHIPQPWHAGGDQDQRGAGLAANDRGLRAAGFRTDGHGNATGLDVFAGPTPAPAIPPEAVIDTAAVKAAEEESGRYWRGRGYEVDDHGAPLPQKPSLWGRARAALTRRKEGADE